MEYTPVGIDIAKHLIQAHFIDENTGEIVDKQIRREAFLIYFRSSETLSYRLEACGGAQH